MTNDIQPQREHFVKVAVLHWTALMNDAVQ